MATNNVTFPFFTFYYMINDNKHTTLQHVSVSKKGITVVPIIQLCLPRIAQILYSLPRRFIFLLSTPVSSIHSLCWNYLPYSHLLKFGLCINFLGECVASLCLCITASSIFSSWFAIYFLSCMCYIFDIIHILDPKIEFKF